MNNIRCDVNYPNNHCGVWLSTGNKLESVNICGNLGQLYVAYNAPNHSELGACKIALSFTKNGIELQYFGSDNKNDIKFIEVDNKLVYNLFFNLLKELEKKALETQPVKPILK